MTAHLHVGTTGFRHPHWVGSIYPSHTGPAQLLATYSRRYSALELPLDSVNDLLLAAELDDDGPRLVVTLPSQWIQMQGSGLPFHPGIDVLELLATSGSLAGVRLPMPSSLPPTREHAVRLRRLAKIFADQGLLVDLPGGRWRTPAVRRWLERINVSTTWTASPGQPARGETVGPTGLVRVPPSRGGRHGYERLRRLVPALARLARSRAEVLVLLEDSGRGSATAEDADELIDLLLDTGLVVGGRERGLIPAAAGS
jgi:hypothetical protein